MRRCSEFNTKTRVLLIDDNYDHLMGVRELINLENDIDVVAAAQNANIAIKNNASDFEALFFDLVNSIFFVYFISHEYAEPSAKSACCFPTPSVLFALYR